MASTNYVRWIRCGIEATCAYMCVHQRAPKRSVYPNFRTVDTSHQAVARVLLLATAVKSGVPDSYMWRLPLTPIPFGHDLSGERLLRVEGGNITPPLTRWVKTKEFMKTTRELMHTVCTPLGRPRINTKLSTCRCEEQAE